MDQPDPPHRAAPPAPSGGWLARLWDRYVRTGVEEEERASRALTAARPPERIDHRTVWVLVMVALMLTALEYFSKRGFYIQTFLEPGDDPYDPDIQLGQLLYWSGWCFVGYFLLPALMVRVALRERLRDYGLSWRGVGAHAWVYALMFLIMVPIVYVVSAEPSFQRTYPFYDVSPESGARIWVWEAAYALQFFSLEFFFRGFMVHGLKRRFGPYAIMVMVVPYCMIHFGKPFPETVGSIIAGVVLGFLSLRTGSIMLGFLIHVSVALIMDLMSLWRQGLLGGVF